MKKGFKVFPKDFYCLIVHLFSLVWAVLLIVYRPESTDLIRHAGSKSLPDLWFPAGVLIVNIYFLFLERSILGFISTAGCVFWLIYTKVLVSSIL